jgi:hypothetical protein
MLKTRLFKLFLLTFFAPLLTAYSANNLDFQANQEKPVTEIRYGYFFFTDPTLKKVYNDGAVDIQLSRSYTLRKNLQFYTSIEYLYNHGRSLFGNQKTFIYEIAVNLGFKPVIPISSWLNFYFIPGLRYSYVHQKNESSYVDKVIRQNGLGGFIDAGFNFVFKEYFLIDLFGEYSYVKVKCHPDRTNVYSSDTQIGGVTFGLGLGYAF